MSAASTRVLRGNRDAVLTKIAQERVKREAAGDDPDASSSEDEDFTVEGADDVASDEDAGEGGHGVSLPLFSHWTTHATCIHTILSAGCTMHEHIVGLSTLSRVDRLLQPGSMLWMVPKPLIWPPISVLPMVRLLLLPRETVVAMDR